MSRKILLAAALTAFAASGLAQTTTQTSTTPANGQPFGGPLLVTPNATLSSPPPAAGISDAGRAGISVNSNAAAVNATAPSTTPPTAIQTNASDMTGNESVSVAPAVSVPAGSETAPADNAPTGDLSPSVTINDASATVAPIGVAEAATRYKSEKTTVNARTLDNNDVQQILSGKESTITASNQAVAANGQPINGQPVPAGVADQKQNSATAQSAAPVQTGSNTSAENTTAPQINENQQSNDAQGVTRLPATSTFLPLLGLMGIASGSFGLWFRKFRK